MIYLLLAKILAMTALAYAFGASHAMGELLHRGGYRWFPRSRWLVPLVASAAAVGMLWLAHPTVYVAFIALLASWSLAGRLFCVDGVLIASAMLGYIGTQTPILAVDPWAMPYFLTTLGGAAAIGRLVRRRTGPVARLLRHLFEGRYHFYAVGVGYALLFELDSPLFLALYGFMSGATAVVGRARAGKLRSWGLQRAEGAHTARD